MAISAVIITQVTNDLGFSRWNWVPLIRSNVLDTIISNSNSKIPRNLIPTTQFQIAAETSTCSINAPWGGFDDPYSEFFNGGGTSGTLLGALNGLNIVSQSFLQKSSANYGLGREYVGPQLGYCIGTLFKEKIYSEVTAENVLNSVFLGTSDEDIIFRSKFERFYLHHGLVNSFEVLDSPTGKFKVTIDTRAETTSVGTIDFSDIHDTITIYKKEDGSSTTFTIDEVRGIDGAIEIDITFVGDPEAFINFQSGDFFVLSRSWLIQDPYLLDGLISNILTGTLPTGTQEFFNTDQNASISEASVTGTYIRRRNLAVGDKVTVDGKLGTVIDVETDEETDEETGEAT